MASPEAIVGDVAAGQQLATQCLGCHSIDGSTLVGPSWKDLYGHDVELEDGTIVMWTSSEVQLQTPPYDYLSPEEVSRLVQQRAVLSPQTTRCTVPAAVTQSMQAAPLIMQAFGPEANFSHPARPANAPRGWAPEWTVKVRTRSTHMSMLGMDMAAMMGGAEADEPAQPQREQKRRRRFNPLERILGQ